MLFFANYQIYPDFEVLFRISGTYSNSGEQVIIEDQLVSFFVTMNPTAALSFERATYDVQTALVDPVNVVSYNAFPDAIGDMQNGAYGGLETFDYQLVLEAEGYSVSISARYVTINAPENSIPGQPVPGAKITYTIVLKNNSDAVAADITVKDKVPASCHMYYHADNYPDVVGEDTNYTWDRDTSFEPRSMAVSGTDVVFNDIYIPANEYVTLNYTVTID